MGGVGTCRNDCPGVRGIEVGIGFGIVASALGIAGSALVPPFTLASSVLLGYSSMSRAGRCPEVCKLRFGQCLRGRRCRMLQNSSQTSNTTNSNANRRRFKTQFYQTNPEQLLADMRGKSYGEQLKIVQEYGEQCSFPDNYVKRRDDDHQIGFFHESLGFVSKLFDTVYNYIFE